MYLRTQFNPAMPKNKTKTTERSKVPAAVLTNSVAGPPSVDSRKLSLVEELWVLAENPRSRASADGAHSAIASKTLILSNGVSLTMASRVRISVQYPGIIIGMAVTHCRTNVTVVRIL